MARYALALLALLWSAACDDAAPLLTGPGSSKPPALEAPATVRPWAVRFVRSCSEWAHRDLLATPTHVFACDGAIFDRESGALIEVRDRFMLAKTTFGSSSLWEVAASSSLVVRDATLADSAEIEVPEQVADAARSPDGARVLLEGFRTLFSLDPDARTVAVVPGGEACAGRNFGVGFTRDGSIQCLVPCGDQTCLRTLGQSREPTLRGEIATAVWDPRGGRLVALAGQTVRWVSEDGAVIADRAVTDDPQLLAMSDDGHLLIAADGDTQRWSLDDGQIHVERVYEQPAEQGDFAGEEIVLSVQPRHLVWLHRGSPREPAARPPSPPDGWRALRAIDGDPPTFEGDGSSYSRGPNDVAAFYGARPDESDLIHIAVSHGDREEMAAFTDDAAWARAVTARYVEPGAERWARYYRDGSHRVVRGHSYIGGCERVHIDVAVRERADVLERWVVYSQEGRGTDAVLGLVPEDARDIPEARSDDYPGDPSIGRVN